ncbi:hypothetical protein [Labrys sp. ZIDIC5]|uniref:hypothetical protein n=1 Tax=Labrys sedimenti TaxID=3106036 RepID=UPI002ACA9D10|nr:hypothetical protein [Labrys sp. ZIDIC5]MDZ5448932.1 hypothetical protein [Labrys sp. ZIDIC5]
MIKLITAIVCDQVRFEVGSKLILIGCYHSVVGVPQLPAKVPLSWVVVADMPEIGSSKVVFEVLLDGRKKPLAQFDSEIEVTGPDYGALLPIPMIDVHVDRPSVVNLRGRVNDGSWKSLKKVRILHLKSIQDSENQ